MKKATKKAKAEKPAPKEKEQGTESWKREVRGIFLALAKAAKEDRLVLVEGRADDDTEEGLPVAVIAEKLIVSEAGGRLHPLAIVMDHAMLAAISAPGGRYEMFDQAGELHEVDRVYKGPQVQ